MKFLIQLSIFISLAFMISSLTACSDGTMGEKFRNNTGTDIANGNYLKLNLPSRNSITRGGDIFETVMKKYQPVLDFYGADSEIFQKMVNTSLLPDAENLTSSSENMFNNESLRTWGDTEFIIEYDDGSREAIPADEILTDNGSHNSGLHRDGKKISNCFVKKDAAEKYKKNIINNIAAYTQKFNKYRMDMTNGSSIQVLHDVRNVDNLNELCSSPATICKYNGYAGLSINTVKINDTADSDQIESKTDGMKTDYTSELIKGLYEQPEFIKDRLNQIKDTITNKAGKTTHLDLNSMMEKIYDKITTLDNVQSSYNKGYVALNLAMEIDEYIMKYRDNYEEDYSNFIDYQTKNTTDPEYMPLQVNIQVPHERHYESPSADGVRIECQLANFTMKNPNLELPFSFEALEYLKKIYITRLRINSYIETEDVNLNRYNSKTALAYLNTSDSYIGKLRNEINQAYKNINQELTKTKNNINGPAAGTWTAANQWTIKETWSCYLRNMTGCMFSGNYIPYSGYPPAFAVAGHGAGDGGIGYDLKIVLDDGSIVSDGQSLNDRGIPDRWNYQPSFSSYPFGEPLLTQYGYDRIPVQHDYPYAPNVVFGTNTPIEFTKPVNDVNFLDDAAASIDLYYKSKSNKLLEFAASLAALEIQLALYLDNEDYKQYNPDYVQ